MTGVSEVSRPAPGEWLRTTIKRITGWREFNVVLAVVLLSVVLALSRNELLRT